jgi:hypothetical protein
MLDASSRSRVMRPKIRTPDWLAVSSLYTAVDLRQEKRCSSAALGANGRRRSAKLNNEDWDGLTATLDVCCAYVGRRGPRHDQSSSVIAGRSPPLSSTRPNCR